MFELKSLPRSLTAALRDVVSAKEAVRISAIADLTRHARDGELRAAEGLERALDDAAPAVRAAAALGLADSDCRAALARLLPLAQSDPAVHVRQMALLALGELATPEQAEVLTVLGAALRAEAAQERFQALLALHQLRAPAIRAALIEATVDPDPEVRRLAFRVAEAEWAEEELPEIVHARARAALGEAAIGVRIAAALLLGRFGDASGSGVLRLLVQRKLAEASHEDEQAAVELCGELGLEEARAALERRAFGLLLRDPLAFEARIALARLGHARASAEILRGLSAMTFHSRTLAVIAAGKARLAAAVPRLRELAERPERADPAAVAQALDALEAEGPGT